MRLESWPEALSAYLDERRDMPFAWGTNDCCAFAADAVQAVTGERPLLPAYESERDALRLLRDRSLRERVGDVFGAEIAPAFARRGDLAVFMQDDERETLAVCVGDYLAAPGPDGMLLVPRAAAIAAWRV